jgi:hypothetical protein
MSPYEGKSEMVYINNALRLKRRDPLGWEKLSVGMPCHRCFNSSNNGRRYTSMFPSIGDCLLEIKMHSEMNNFV